MFLNRQHRPRRAECRRTPCEHRRRRCAKLAAPAVVANAAVGIIRAQVTFRFPAIEIPERHPRRPLRNRQGWQARLGTV